MTSSNTKTTMTHAVNLPRPRKRRTMIYFIIYIRLYECSYN